MHAIRDPIHGFVRTDALESALLASRPFQRLRHIRQLGFAFLVFPGAEHTRFAHALGTMHLAGRVYDALASRSGGRLDPDPRCRERRLVRVAALLHDVGHAPFSHVAEGRFEEGIDHEAMTQRLLHEPEMGGAFARLGEGVDAEAVGRVLAKTGRDDVERLLSEIVSSELDVDKMDYLLRDSLFCGVRYGSYDLERLVDVMAPLEDRERGGALRLGVDAGGIHALEALVMARYYMFTQVYFNATSKVMELHFNAWLRSQGILWPASPEAFLEHDDVSVLAALRRSESLHARAVLRRERYTLAYETGEHLPGDEQKRFAETVMPALGERFGAAVLVDHSAKNPHQLASSRVLVRGVDGSQRPMDEVSDFIRHLSRIACYRVYAARDRRDAVTAQVKALWER